MTTTLKNPAKEFLAMPVEPKWAPVSFPGLSSKYRISTLGSVVSPEGRPVATFLQGVNLAVAIKKTNGTVTSQRIDRLMLSTFVRFEALQTPKHIDDKPENCCLDNLVWVEPSVRELAGLKAAEAHRKAGGLSRKKGAKKPVVSNGEVVKPRATRAKPLPVQTEPEMTRTYKLRGMRVEVGEDGDIRSMDPNPAKGLSIGHTMALGTIMARVTEMNRLIGAHKNL
jgi:hypothetical protein